MRFLKSKSGLTTAVVVAFSLLLLLGGIWARRTTDDADTPQMPEVTQSAEEPTAEPITIEELTALKIRYNATLVFGGDVNLSEGWPTMNYLAAQESLSDCIDQRLLEEMQNADLCCINNEFAFSDRGEPMAGKYWTFRAKPENVALLQEMGADVATLANNHVYDYGAEAFSDTLTTLHNAGIGTVGAGENLAEAATPYYTQLGDLKVAIVNASRAEKTQMTPGAGEDSAGIMLCYDTAAFEQEIAEARQNADLVICCVHWGTEYTSKLEDAQKESARRYIDAGADIIVGTHSHCLQGIEYYNGKPIFYSLGNFWFNEKDLETGLLKLTVTGDATQGVQLGCTFVPAIQSGCVTSYAESMSDRGKVFDLLNSISVNAQVDADGVVSPVE